MKNQKFSFLFVSLILLSGSVFGQQEKGDKQMQFSLSFTDYSSNGNSTSSLMWQYSVSKFFTKHAEMGFSYIGFTQKTISTNSIAPFFNLNILSHSGKFVFYLGAQ